MPNLIDTFFNEKIHIKPIFSLCLGTNFGYFSIDANNSFSHLKNTNEKVVVKIIEKTSKNLYNINIHGLLAGNIDSGLKLFDFNSQQGSFIDSGTTYFYANHHVYSSILKTIHSYCEKNNCFKFTEKNKCFFSNENAETLFKKFPKLLFKLDNNQIYEWRPENYIVKYMNNKHCIIINKYYGRVILGGIWMKDHDFVFDRQNKTVTIYKANCSKYYNLPSDALLLNNKSKISGKNEKKKQIIVNNTQIVVVKNKSEISNNSNVIDEKKFKDTTTEKNFSEIKKNNSKHLLKNNYVQKTGNYVYIIIFFEVFLVFLTFFIYYHWIYKNNVSSGLFETTELTEVEQKSYTQDN